MWEWKVQIMWDLASKDKTVTIFANDCSGTYSHRKIDDLTIILSQKVCICKRNLVHLLQMHWEFLYLILLSLYCFSRTSMYNTLIGKTVFIKFNCL
jgi:hypothetical protein